MSAVLEISYLRPEGRRVSTTVWKNFAEYDNLIKKTYNGNWKFSELGLKKSLPLVFSAFRDQITLTGKIDGVYTYMDGTVEKHVIVDFKTSKRTDSHYVDQLSLYAKLYSLENGIDFNRVEAEIAYLSLRDEKINIGKRYWKNERVPFEIINWALKNIENYVKSFIDYRNSVDAFIRDVIDIHSEDALIKAFIEEIKKETGNP